MSISLNSKNIPVIRIEDKIKNFNDEREFKTYITGRWFEEYVYNNLKRLFLEKIILDLKYGLELEFENNVNSNDANKKEKYQEFDTMFTDGYRLYIVECKTGPIESDHISKLESLARQYGGIEGRGILLYADNYTPSDVISKKISESKNVKVFFGDNIIDETIKYIKSLNKLSTKVEGNTSDK